MTQKTIVVIGGAHGGPTAAARARQFNENARIILIEKSSHVTWVQADLRYHLEGDVTRLESKLAENERFFAQRYGIEVMNDATAIALDMDSRYVIVQKGEEQERLSFDSVVFAGGAISKTIDLDGLCGPYVSNFRNLDDIRKIKASIAKGAKKVVVLGCGFYGIEAAEGLRGAGLKVEVVEKAPRIMPRFSLPVARAMERKLKSLGTQVHLGDYVTHASPRKKMGFKLKLASSKTLEADFVVVTVGSRPRTELLQEAGAALQKDGSVRVDAQMATTLPNVFACGSAVSVPQIITHERMWLPQPAVIERTAQIAGHNAGIGPGIWQDSLLPVNGTQMLRIGDDWFARTGLTGSETRKYYGDERVFTATVHSRSTEVWFEGDDLSVNLSVNQDNERIVGGEVWGKAGVARRIDLIAAAVMHEWRPTNLVDLDMAYAASLGPAFDPLKEAGSIARMMLLESTKIMSGDKLVLWMAEEKPFTLIDVSMDSQASKENWSDAVMHVPLEQLRNRLSEIDQALPVVISSRSGRRSVLAQRVLMQRGFEDVYHLDGGSTTWSLMMGEG